MRKQSLTPTTRLENKANNFVLQSGCPMNLMAKDNLGTKPDTHFI